MILVILNILKAIAFTKCGWHKWLDFPPTPNVRVLVWNSAIQKWFWLFLNILKVTTFTKCDWHKWLDILLTSNMTWILVWSSTIEKFYVNFI